MRELFDLADYLANYTKALHKGFNRFVNEFQTVAQSQLKVIARQKLHNSAETYVNAIQSTYENNMLVVVIDEHDWLANALENGVNSWPMTQTHLNGKNTLVIPINPWKNRSNPAAYTDKGMSLWESMRSVTSGNPASTIKGQWMNPDGTMTTYEKMKNTDENTKNLMRNRKWKNPNDFFAGKQANATSYVLFRTMSKNHPEKFIHPGIVGIHAMKEVKAIMDASRDKMLKTAIESELMKLKYIGD